MVKYARRGPDGLGLWPMAAPSSQTASADSEPDYAVGT
jgi:hypothetical protein